MPLGSELFDVMVQLVVACADEEELHAILSTEKVENYWKVLIKKK